ncbi:MAG: HTH-type transcriptional regulator CymR [Syntrophorhabdaceae bacterium PtaU1.Bin034]|jgi:Rrf2 family protein|nr:MAG: HTH-type transcriptional regulator CymR [Syntrophorhabdaceae bacterium PtaU1.Bin034]
MKVSTKGRYGLRAMMDLAANQKDDVPVFLSDVAKRQRISEKYLEQIFSTLRAAGLVNTVRGRKGGFLLASPPSQITVSTIITVLEGPCTLVDCVAKPKTCPKSDTCAARDIWSLLGNKIDEVLSSYTLEALVAMQEEKSEKETPMYYI